MLERTEDGEEICVAFPDAVGSSKERVSSRGWRVSESDHHPAWPQRLLSVQHKHTAALWDPS